MNFHMILLWKTGVQGVKTSPSKINLSMNKLLAENNDTEALEDMSDSLAVYTRGGIGFLHNFPKMDIFILSIVLYFKYLINNLTFIINYLSR